MVMMNSIHTPQEFADIWEKNYLPNKGNCAHHDRRFNEGWIPLACATYSPVLGRYNANNDLADTIKAELEGKGVFKFQEHCFFVPDLEPALRSISLNDLPQDIMNLIHDGYSCEFMLDRRAYTTDGTHVPSDIQWYFAK